MWCRTPTLTMVVFFAACSSGSSGDTDYFSASPDAEQPDATPIDLGDWRPDESNPVRAAATDMVLQDVVGVATLDHSVFVYATRLPLSAGTTITDDAGEGAPIVLDEAAWLYFVDDAPWDLYAHPTRFVLVAAGGDEVLATHERNWWPRIDGEPSLGEPHDALAVFGAVRGEDRAALGGALSPPSGIVAGALAKDPCAKGGTPKCRALLATGTDSFFGRLGFLSSMTKWTTMLEGMGCNVATVATNAANVRVGLETLAEVSDCCDTVVLGFFSHGGKVNQGDVQVSSYLRLSEGEDGAFTANELVGWLEKIPSCHINVYVGACYSGGFVDALKGAERVAGVHSSSVMTKETTPIGDPNVAKTLGGKVVGSLVALWDQVMDTGIYHANILAEQMTLGYENNPDLGVDELVAKATAVTNQITTQKNDEPQSWSRPANATCACCGDGEKEEKEECDDGNRESGDGCTAKCEVELDPCVQGESYSMCCYDGTPEQDCCPGCYATIACDPCAIMCNTFKTGGPYDVQCVRESGPLALTLGSCDAVTQAAPGRAEQCRLP